MTVQFYVEQSDSAYKSGIADTDIYAGTIVSNEGSGVGLADAQNGIEAIDGLALYSETFMTAEDEDAVAEEKYASDERVKYAPLEDTLRGYGRTLTDDGGSAPSIGHEDVVGLVDTSVGDAPTGSKGRLVEEGYENGATTFNRSNSNFVALGEAYRPARSGGGTVDGYDEVVRVDFFGTPQK